MQIRKIIIALKNIRFQKTSFSEKSEVFVRVVFVSEGFRNLVTSLRKYATLCNARVSLFRRKYFRNLVIGSSEIISNVVVLASQINSSKKVI